MHEPDITNMVGGPYSGESCKLHPTLPQNRIIALFVTKKLS